ncbi:MAG: PAS domain S-box protein, partial [Candidatus Magnetominusculus sp. LBB02]|nr:PAS domain S-box protein [Candidatus Magnetominusculus sp. LBB02]
MSIRNKLIIAMLSMSLVPLLLSGLIIYRYSKDTLFDVIEDKLKKTLSVQTSRLSVMIDRNIDIMKMLANRPTLKTNLELYNRTADVNALRYIDEAIGQIRESIPLFHEISILNVNREVVSSSNHSNVGMIFNESEVLPEQYSNCGYVDVSKGEDKFPDLRFSCHLKLKDKIVGYVTAVVHGGFLNEVTGDYTNLGKTGEMVLAKKDEDGNALFIVPLRFDGNAAFTRKVSKDDTNILITHALQRKKYLFREYKDYNGVPVYGVTGYLEKTGWGIVVKMYKSELMEPLVRLKQILILSYLLTMGILITVAVIISRNLTSTLTKLTNAAVQVGKGIYANKITHTADDETGVLVKMFNQMIDLLAARDSQLSKHRQSLENLVHERTVALRAANEHLQAEAAMRKTLSLRLMDTNNKLNSLIEYIPDLVIFKDVQKKYQLVNLAFETITGLSRESVIGKQADDVFPAEIAAAITLEDEAVITTKKTIRSVIMLNGSGKDIYVDIINAPILNNYGGLIGIVIIGRDITQMRLLTSDLSESAEKYRAIVENSPDIISRVDKDHRCLLINSAISNFLDLQPGDLIGKTNYETGIDRFHNSALWQDSVQQVFDCRCPQEIDIELNGRSGLLYFTCQLIPEFDAAGAVKTVVTVSRDITRRVELERKLIEKNELLDDIVRQRTRKLLESNDSLLEEMRQRNAIETQLVREKSLSDTIINTMPEVFCLINEKGKLLLWNKNLEAVTQYSNEETAQMSLFDFLCKEAVRSEINDIFLRRKGDYEEHICCKDGNKILFYFVGSVVDLDGAPYVTLVGIDITERKKMENELETSRQMLRLSAIHLQNTI